MSAKGKTLLRTVAGDVTVEINTLNENVVKSRGSISLLFTARENPKKLLEKVTPDRNVKYQVGVR